MNKKTMLISLGAATGVAAVGFVAAAIYNSDKLRAARKLKRTCNIMYHVGTAMRNLSEQANECM